MRYVFWIETLAVLALAGCSGSTSPYDGGNGNPGGGHSTTITVANDFFTPTPDTVPAGTVTFTWSNASHGHTLIWDSGPGTLPANTGTISSGSRTVTLQVGRYEYHCSIHGAAGQGMHGSIIVQ
jgi:plastocyanin